MTEEKKTVVLKEEKLKQVVGGKRGEIPQIHIYCQKCGAYIKSEVADADYILPHGACPYCRAGGHWWEKTDTLR